MRAKFETNGDSGRRFGRDGHVSPRVCAGAFFCALLAATIVPAVERPNIVIILADDLGYGELGCQGHPHARTPNIDSIARNGVRCTAGYAASCICCPSRAGLITGRYPTRFGVEHNSGRKQTGLPVSETTLGDRLRHLGYATACFGKWDLGHNEPCWLPTSRGFDTHFGTAYSTSLLKPGELFDSRRPLHKAAENGWTEGLPADFYLTTECAKRAVAWMQRENDRPLFLYLPFNATHDPLEAPDEYLKRFAHLDDPMRTFCATLAAMDDGIGMVLEELRRSGRFENTLVIFSSDNGAPSDTGLHDVKLPGRNAPLRGAKGLMLEGGIRVPLAMQWPGILPAGSVYNDPVISLDLVPTAVIAAGGSTESLKDIDGVNLVPYLSGRKEKPPHKALFWRMGQQFAIRIGDWKLVASGFDDVTTGLYNLRDDIREEKDLSKRYPRIGERLQHDWDRWNQQQVSPLWTEGTRPFASAPLVNTPMSLATATPPTSASH